MPASMRRLLAWGLVLCSIGLAHAREVTELRLFDHGPYTRVVFELSGHAEHHLFTLTHPPRVVIDLAATEPGNLPRRQRYRDPRIQAIRAAKRHGRDTRIVLDLKGAADPEGFQLPPRGRQGHRLVVDLRGAPNAVADPPSDEAQEPPAAALSQSPARTPQVQPGNYVIAIDAGHGGKDPGAIGPQGTFEKDITLAVARLLAERVQQTPRLEPYLTRDADVYLPLRERMRRARSVQADLFVSIHADAFHNREARGASVYVLSRQGASSEAARWLAARENAAGGDDRYRVGGLDESVASIVLDLSQTTTIRSSLDLGQRVLDRLGAIGELHKERVQQAGFVVLKAPDFPSILVESAFLSNPYEARKLRSPAHRGTLAETLLAGIRDYLAEAAPEIHLASPRTHQVRRGDTLSELADRYKVEMDHLRTLNRLEGDLLRVGRVLVIPERDG